MKERRVERRWEERKGKKGNTEEYEYLVCYKVTGLVTQLFSSCEIKKKKQN